MNNKYKPLHLKYRPSNFKFLLGQNHIISHFTHCLKYNRLAFAYLFTGKHGTGKTSLALLLAKSLNCLNKNPNSSSSCNKCINCTRYTSCCNITLNKKQYLDYDNEF